MKELVCQFCAGQDFITCQQPKGYAGLTPAGKKITFQGTTLYHEVCKDCGTVARTYVKDVSKLANEKV